MGLYVGEAKVSGLAVPSRMFRPAKWLALMLKATDLTFGSSEETAKSPAHNAIWYLPTSGQTLAIRLEGRVGLRSDIGQMVSKYLDSDWISKTPHLSVVAKRTAALNQPAGGMGGGARGTLAVDLTTEVVLGVELDIGAPRSFGIYVAILEEYVTLMLVCYSRELTWSALKTWLLKNCQGISSAVGQLQDNLEKISGAPGVAPEKKPQPSAAIPDAGSKPDSLSGIYWRKVSASISESGIQAVHIELEASVPFLVARGKHAGFSMSFSWRPGQCEFECEFMGDGVARPDLSGAAEAEDAALVVPPQYKADYERWTYLEPLVLSEPFMSLRYLKSRDSPLTNDEIPYGVPTEIAQVALAVSNTGLSFSGKLQSLLGAEEAAAEGGNGGGGGGGGVPVLGLAYVDLDFALAVDYSSKPTNIMGWLEGVVALEPRPDPVTGRVRMPAELRAKIEYGTMAPGSWNFEASVARIPLTSLYSLFARGSEQDAAMAMLSNITLERMTIGYTYSGAAASSVRFSASATVGGLAVDTRFLRIGPGQWLFGAQLAPRIAENSSSVEVVGVPAGMKKVTLFDATRDLLGADVAELLPDFIQDTELLISTASGGRDKLSIECRRVEGKPNDKLVFGATLSFGTLRVHFGQITTLLSKADDEAAVKKAKEGPLPGTSGKAAGDKPLQSKVKRLIRVTLGPLPTMQSLPLVGSLELPCDTLEFMWLGADLSSADLSTISGVLDSGVDGSPVSIAVASGEELLAQGYYFRLLGKDNSVVVSYPFGHTPKPKAKGATGDGKVDTGVQKVAAEPSKLLPPQAPTAVAEIKTAERKSTEVATMAPIKKQKGSVKLSGVGLTFEGGVLRIHLDARVLVGPIGAGVNGLQINLNLNKVKGLHNLLDVGLSVDIQGFEMSFDRSPILLSGALEHEKTASANRFSGGIAISVKAISINALGMYEQVYAQPPLPAYDSFFVYGMVEGTLFTVGWAEVRGIIAGFGYNSRLRLPPVDQLMSFPLVSGFDDGGGVSILSALDRLTGKGGPDAWISPSMGSLWFAAGLVIRACQTLDIRAVATLALGPNQKEIGLLARATACLPRGSTPEKALMLIDLSILGKLDLVRGELAVDGLINPTSFILSKDCRPSGGFAIRTWFHGEQKNPYAGDWVVTFGGYHPSFRAPAHYPNPGRLRINWAISSCLRVTGEAYAAITPGAVMAGARLSAVFSKGALQAYFDAHADFLVNMAPLHYEATVAVRAGVSYEIRIWKLRKKLSIEIGARLELEGPPLGGCVRFEASVVSFTVDFGARGKRGTPAALKLGEFVDLVLKESSDEGAKAKNPHTLAVVSGRIADGRGAQDKKTKPQEPWLVRADAFMFSMRSPVPLSTYKVLESQTGIASIAGNSGQQILSRPMKLKPGDGQKVLQSNLTVAAYPVTPGLPPVTLTRVAETWDHVPSNLWGAFSDNRDDYLRPDKIAPTVNHLVGLTLRAPQPKLPKDSLTITKTSERVWASDTSRVKAATAAALMQSAAQSSRGRSTRYTIDSNARESVQWSRVQGAMVPSVGSSVAVAGAKGRISREEVLDEFLRLLYPEKSDAVAGSAAGSTTTTPSDAGLRRAYRRIGARAPRVVVDQPQRYYRAAPVVFVS
ncbi:DUF6603 domain-containing protein [Microdochium nivale]|nr:DUF6603 domain-containing protein [Microdochium nivale]